MLNEEEVQAYDEENEYMEEQGGEAEIEDVTVSINAMHGNVSAGTLRVKGMVNRKEIHILIDSGSTHSFIDEKVVKALGFKVEPTTPMMVSVADGYRMISKDEKVILRALPQKKGSKFAASESLHGFLGRKTYDLLGQLLSTDEMKDKSGWSDHLHHLRRVLELLRTHKLYAKQSKCSFAQQQVECLGHVISIEGVSTDPQKVQCMGNWPAPTSVKALREFLGLTGYYRKFIKGYGIISKPLTTLLKKEGFLWNEEAEVAFNKLKEVMCTAPVLALPDFTKPFVVETDACGRGIGVVLMQEGRPIANLSKALATKNLGLSTYGKEFLALLLAVTKWKHYLQGHHFIIRTDQKSLKHILDQRVDSVLQHKWITKLLGLSYEIQYKKGHENRAADALSRREPDLTECQTYGISTQLPLCI
ncbi:UNVERIFIED_CONTAM: Retrovirus-related Pol polyprotein from transposon.6 [Sesamum angustifolium]|uniref:Retrovirus-related Pol polyprotein from transposon.6 n=1 Tax=Sesamum angustifolium TaxID=2727405 RepID=A0AAW2LG13_9LAMI